VSVTFVPGAASWVEGMATATGALGSVASPDVMTGTVVSPPLSEMTVNVAGGASTFSMTVPSAVTVWPSAVRVPGVESWSLEEPATFSVLAVASYDASVTLTRSTSFAVFVATGMSLASITSTDLPSGAAVTAGGRSTCPSTRA
jgi:hypothetical protein